MTKKKLKHISIIVLYLLVPVFIFGIIGQSVNRKFEVDDPTNYMDATKEELKSVEIRANEIERNTNLFIAGAIVSFATATVMLWQKKKNLNEKIFST